MLTSKHKARIHRGWGKQWQLVKNEMMSFKDHESKLDMVTQDLYTHI